MRKSSSLRCVIDLNSMPADTRVVGFSSSCRRLWQNAQCCATGTLATVYVAPQWAQQKVTQPARQGGRQAQGRRSVSSTSSAKINSEAKRVESNQQRQVINLRCALSGCLGFANVPASLSQLLNCNQVWGAVWVLNSKPEDGGPTRTNSLR